MHLVLLGLVSSVQREANILIQFKFQLSPQI